MTTRRSHAHVVHRINDSFSIVDLIDAAIDFLYALYLPPESNPRKVDRTQGAPASNGRNCSHET
jgi:hypothetical protein